MSTPEEIRYLGTGLQQRFHEVWAQHQRMLLALENARDVVHRTHCLPQPVQQCWKECEEAMDAMLEAGWMPPVQP